ncbi:MAG: ABC transporter permease subunit [Lacisediminihabitans sp.]
MTTTLEHNTRNTVALSGLTFGGILRSEWIKLRTLRSTMWCYAVIIVLMIGFGVLLAVAMPAGGIGVQSNSATADQQQATWLQVTTLGIGFGELVAAVLGALVITGEYGTGMIRSTLTAVPKRTPALIAKALVFGVTTFIVSLIALVATALSTAPLMPGKAIHPNFGDADFWLALVGGAGYLALIGILGLAIGAIIRSSAGGISAALGLILVVPVLAQIVAGVTRATWAGNLGSFLPSSAGGRMYAYGPTALTPPKGVVSLDAGQGLLVLALWCVVIFVIGAVLLKRRDA